MRLDEQQRMSCRRLALQLVNQLQDDYDMALASLAYARELLMWRQERIGMSSGLLSWNIEP